MDNSIKYTEEEKEVIANALNAHRKKQQKVNKYAHLYAEYNLTRKRVKDLEKGDLFILLNLNKERWAFTPYVTDTSPTENNEMLLEFDMHMEISNEEYLHKSEEGRELHSFSLRLSPNRTVLVADKKGTITSAIANRKKAKENKLTDILETIQCALLDNDYRVVSRTGLLLEIETSDGDKRELHLFGSSLSITKETSIGDMITILRSRVSEDVSGEQLDRLINTILGALLFS